MPRRKTTSTTDMFDLSERLSTAPCVPAIRHEVDTWRYVKVGQVDFEKLQPTTFVELSVALTRATSFLL